MKLELKHLAPYLPYGLRCEILNYKCDYVGEKYGIVNGYYFAFNEPHYTFKDRNTAGKDQALIKPILRPLSDLTKEINLECEGQFIVGGERIRDWHDLDPMRCNYEQLTYLLDHHYDIHGLIKEGLAIDINTIES